MTAMTMDSYLLGGYPIPTPYGLTADEETPFDKVNIILRTLLMPDVKLNIIEVRAFAYLARQLLGDSLYSDRVYIALKRRHIDPGFTKEKWTDADEY